MEFNAKAPRARDAVYLYKLHSLPCIICTRRPVEAAHIRLTDDDMARVTGWRTGAGGAEKPADVWALPLCVQHHREGPDAEHVIGTKEFWRRHHIDPHRAAWRLYSAHMDGRDLADEFINITIFGACDAPTEAA